MRRPCRAQLAQSPAGVPVADGHSFTIQNSLVPAAQFQPTALQLLFVCVCMVLSDPKADVVPIMRLENDVMHLHERVSTEIC